MAVGQGKPGPDGRHGPRGPFLGVDVEKTHRGRTRHRGPHGGHQQEVQGVLVGHAPAPGIGVARFRRPRQLLILDEPTNGMDPQGTRKSADPLRQLGEQGTTVFLSSHLLSEIEQVCSHVGVMHRGKLLMQGPLSQLRAGAVPKLRVETDDPGRASEVLAGMGMSGISREGQQLVGSLDGLRAEDCCRCLVEAGVGVRMLVPEQASLEDAFVALTGEGFNVAG